DPAEMAVCGAGYSPSTPTAGLLAGGLSRITTPDAIALQVVHASAAMPLVDVRITPGNGTNAAKQLAPQLSLGAIGPFPPFNAFSKVDYGSLSQVKLQTYAPGAGAPTSTAMLTDAFTSGAVATSEFTDGKGFALVAVGAAPGTAVGPWWHA